LASSARKLFYSFRLRGSANPRSNPIWVQKEGAGLASGAAAAGEVARLEHFLRKNRSAKNHAQPYEVQTEPD